MGTENHSRLNKGKTIDIENIKQGNMRAENNKGNYT